MPETRADDLANAVDQLLDVALSRHHDSTADETFIECHMCHQWDGHMGKCPVPYLQHWLETPEKDPKP